MELRERIARAIIPRMYHGYEGWDAAELSEQAVFLEVADDVIETLGLTREEGRVEPRPGSTTKFAPHTVERHVTRWERRN